VKKYALSCLLAFVVSLLGCEQASDDFTISNLVIREMPPGKKVAVAYLRLENLSKKNLIFNYLHSPRAESIEVHQHLHKDGVMQMRAVNHFSVSPESRVDFVPRGYHLMLFGVEERFVEGEKVEITFEFENYPPKTVVADVKRL